MVVSTDTGAGAVPTDASTAQCDAAPGRGRLDERSYGTLTGRTEVQCRPASDHHGRVY